MVIVEEKICHMNDAFKVDFQLNPLNFIKIKKKNQKASLFLPELVKTFLCLSMAHRILISVID